MRLVTLVSLPCMVVYATSAFAAIEDIATDNASLSLTTKAENKDASTKPTTAFSKNAKSLEPTLVGVLVNGEELGSIDALYDSASDPKRDDSKDCYFVSIDDLAELTKASFSSLRTDNNDNASKSAASNNYAIVTPIGNTQISGEQVFSYQGQDYLSLNSLKKLGITATYSQSDLAIILNMGWRPAQIGVGAVENDTRSLPVDYHPSRAGLLGLSFDSTLSASESNGYFRDNQSNITTNKNNKKITSRQMYADLGAFGYALGGVWGINASGYDYDSSNEFGEDKKSRIAARDSFIKNAFNGFRYSPTDWDDWEIDNLYWAKSGKQLATRLGINRPNALSQGAQTTGAEFTGAMLAYSNRDIGRHLSYFDEDSRSLLQNTSQDYQHLTGIGEAGGVAELRINGQSLARVQIGLDGRYEFLNLDVSQLALTDTLVEIAIYAYPLASQPLEVRPIVLGKRRTNVATDELLIEAGIGRSGNLLSGNNSYGLENNQDNDDTAAHLYTEYGINNRLAVRGGVNTNLQTLSVEDNDDSLSWHAGVNYSLSPYTNIDLSYADTPVQDLWQAQLQYQRDKLLAYYQYQARQYDRAVLDIALPNNRQIEPLNDQLHQLLINYSPSDRTNISLNQYYNDMAVESRLDDYYAYASVNHRFNDALNVGANWSSRDDRYGYRINWQDIYRDRNISDGTRNTLGLSGDNNSDTLSLRHQFNERTSLGQAVSVLHSDNRLLNQGDISYRFADLDLWGADASSIGASAIDNLVSIGYSLFDGKVGWQADWQLTHRNGVNFSLGYKHRYVDTIPSNRYDDLVNEVSFIDERLLPAWTQNNYLFAKLSFDMFKPPKQNLKFGQYPRRDAGSVIVDLNHSDNLPVVEQNMRFELDNKPVQANLLSTQGNHSQYLISDVIAGDYTLTMDNKNLPLEYSSSELISPRIKVANYAPTTVPIKLEKTYGVSGKLATAKEGVVIEIYQRDELVKKVTTESYGYFQAFGLAPASYTLKAEGYKEQTVRIIDDFLVGLKIWSESSSSIMSTQ